MAGLVLGLYMFVLAAILGVILLIMEGDIPGWGTLLLCVLAAIIPSSMVNSAVQGFFGLPGAIVGSISAGFAISFLTGMMKSCLEPKGGDIYLPPVLGTW